MGGNPLAELTWYRGENSVPGTVTVKGDGDYSKSDLVIVVNRTDNGLPYRCEASNAASPEPRSASVTMKVLFKPATVTIR